MWSVASQSSGGANMLCAEKTPQVWAEPGSAKPTVPAGHVFFHALSTYKIR